MKILSNKSILPTIIGCCALLFSCSTHNYERTDYVGVYYYKLLYKEYGILNYLILRNDSTYQLVYIEKNDTLLNMGKWYLKNDVDITEVGFFDWCFLGKGKERAHNNLRGWMITFYESPSCLEFDPDVNVDFWRIDSLEAIQLGIKEEDVIWNMNPKFKIN